MKNCVPDWDTLCAARAGRRLGTRTDLLRVIRWGAPVS